MRAPKESLEMREKLDQEVEEEQWDPLEEMANEEGLVVMENVEEVVPLEPRENKGILECQGCLVPRVTLVCRASLVNLVLMDLRESLEKMDHKGNLVLRVTWDIVDFWAPEVSQVQLVNQVFLV